MCECGSHLVICSLQEAYGGGQINCDGGCGGQYFDPNYILLNCPKTWSSFHSNGYDLCFNCALLKALKPRGRCSVKDTPKYKVKYKLFVYFFGLCFVKIKKNKNKNKSAHTNHTRNDTHTHTNRNKQTQIHTVGYSYCMSLR